jgi:glucokinase
VSVVDWSWTVGATGNAGHIGHVVVDVDGPACACGGRGCLEAVASGPNLVRWASDQGWSPPPGGTWTGESLASSAAAGHPVALAAFDRGGSALGTAIASAVQLTDVEVVAVGGGLAGAGDLLFAPLARQYARHAGLGFARRPRVAPASLGVHAGLVGAAALVLAGDVYWTGS